MSHSILVSFWKRIIPLVSIVIMLTGQILTPLAIHTAQAETNQGETYPATSAWFIAKTMDGTKVYLVQGHFLQLIPDAVGINVYGSNWKSLINTTLGDAYIANSTIGAPLDQNWRPADGSRTPPAFRPQGQPSTTPPPATSPVTTSETRKPPASNPTSPTSGPSVSTNVPRLVKTANSPKVYVNFPANTIHWIPNEAIALKVFGANWDAQIWVISEAEFKLFIIADPVSANARYPKLVVSEQASSAPSLPPSTPMPPPPGNVPDSGIVIPPLGPGNGGNQLPAVSPTTTHPRLWVTQNDIPRLRAWAVPGNQMYTAFKAALASAKTTYDTKFFPNGLPAQNWPDSGSTNFELYATEAYAEFFAFASLIDPDPAARTMYADHARKLLMHVMDEAVKGQAAGQPFRDPYFATYNRANYWGEAFGLTVDWINSSLSAAEKETIRKVFLRWAYEITHTPGTSGQPAGGYPTPYGLINDKQLVSNKGVLRWSANNYFTGRARNHTLQVLSLDLDANNDAPDQYGKTLKSYIPSLTGAWLYQQYALYENAAQVAADYGIAVSTGTALGAASGGLSVEGSLYGHALGYMAETMLALKTAGYTDKATFGPQVKLIDNSFYWNRFVDGIIHTAEPASHTWPNYGYMGPVYQVAGYGDMLRSWMTTDLISAVGPLGVIAQATGNMSGIQKNRWIAQNLLEGGPGKMLSRAANIWGNANASETILYYLLFNPNDPITPDPRASIPTTFVDNAAGRILARTDWTPNATMFTYMCRWTFINHQLGDCNTFELYRKGEFLTKYLTTYNTNERMSNADVMNSLAIQNTLPAGPGAQPTLFWFEAPIWQHGGQWVEGVNAGDPTVNMSYANEYVQATADSTNTYNRPQPFTPANALLDVTHASRSIVWLKPDYVVVYDRATTKTAGRFKRFNLNMTTMPVLSGKSAVETTPNGQKLYVQTLLPTNPTLSVVTNDEATYPGINVAELEQTKYHLVVEDANKPADVRFLHVLQGADGNVAQTPTQLIQSINGNGTAFSGALVGTTVVLFQNDLKAPFTTLSYIVPNTTTKHIVANLAPNTFYSVLSQNVAGGKQITITVGGGISKTDSAGVLSF